MDTTTPAHHDGHDEDHDRGLQFDLGTLVARRRLLGLFAGAAGATAASSTGRLTETPEETADPYPGDGSNGANILTASGVVRSDIRSSFGSSTTTAPGVPLTITLTVRDTSGTALSGYAVYLWHCDRDGRYSMYTVADENYLRGVQETGADGTVTFTSIFPAAYSGRWPHIRYEVYPSLSAATDVANKIGTSQIALPEETCDVVFATSGYEQSVRNMAQTSLSTDNVFSDGWTTQLATMSGDVTNGFTATITYVV